MFSSIISTVVGVVNVVILVVAQTLAPVAFYTLLERKLMSAIQRRRGPNVVGVWGLLQPVADGVKLLLKENLTPRFAIISAYTFAPLWGFAVAFTCWALIPQSASVYILDNDYSLLLFLAISSTGVYSLVIAGWASYSRYALMGAVRAVAQLVSYEVVLTLFILPPVTLSGSFNLIEIVYAQEGCWHCFPCLPIVAAFYVVILAETNRTPFDLPEAEAELVAGFNVEYSSSLFAMFFLAEYSNMILMSTLMTLLFFGGWLEGTILFVLKVMVLVFSFVIVRALLPRFRYDQLMFLCWRTLLPLALGFILFIFGFCYGTESAPYDFRQLSTFSDARFNDWYATYFKV